MASQDATLMLVLLIGVGGQAGIENCVNNSHTIAHLMRSRTQCKADNNQRDFAELRASLNKRKSA